MIVPIILDGERVQSDSAYTIMMNQPMVSLPAKVESPTRAEFLGPDEAIGRSQKTYGDYIVKAYKIGIPH
jgi:hypothetical protein